MAAPTKKHGSKNRKNKVVLQFDEHARALKLLNQKKRNIDYLKGFHKRKLQRKKDARDKKEKILHNERKALRQKIKDLKTATTFTSKSFTPIPEIEQLATPEVFDMPDHTVTITNFGEVDFVGKTGLRLGRNTGEISPDNRDETGDDDGEEEATPIQPPRDTKAKNKTLLRELASCSNQLAVDKSRRANKKRDAERRHKDKKIKKKQKNKMQKGKKR